MAFVSNVTVEDVKEGVNQSKYTFVLEKDLILTDIKNLCIYYKGSVLESSNNKMQIEQ